MDPEPTLPGFEIQRRFGWGILLIGDAESSDIPLGPGRGVAISTATNICVRVRHAQDVESPSDGNLEVPPFEVSVRCVSGVSHALALCFDGTIDLPSGRLSIGDADDEKILALRPGRWRFQIEVDTRDHPERVYVWYHMDASPAEHLRPTGLR